MSPRIGRREFITVLAGAAGWRLAASAQQGGGMRRIGVLMGYAESNAEGQAFVAAFRDGLLKLGWIEGRGAWRWTREISESTRRSFFAPIALALLMGGAQCHR